jgi:hypothetical protein
MRRSRIIAALSVAFAALVGGAAAKREGWNGTTGTIVRPAPAVTAEWLVFEVAGCLYCEALKRDVLPRWKASPLSARAPMRFVDLNEVDTEKLALRGALRVVPTAILMREGREIDRIAGLVAPQHFMIMAARLVEQID